VDCDGQNGEWFVVSAAQRLCLDMAACTPTPWRQLRRSDAMHDHGRGEEQATSTAALELTDLSCNKLPAWIREASAKV
jgi:hypothetical protein